jgi:hypothetical protein
VGRERPPEVILGSLSTVDRRFNAEAVLEKIGKLRELGVVGAAVHMRASTRAEWCDLAERFGAAVLNKLPRL